MKKSLLLALMFFGTLLTAMAQSTVTGTIKDDTGAPLVGATVTIKGTTTGAVADIDGNYSIKVPNAETVLVFDFVGMTTKEETVGNRSVIDVVLEGDFLEEVVVTGVGEATSKKKIGISVESVGADELIATPSGELSSALQGKIPGANIQSVSGQPGQAQNIILRGINSLSGSQPMILVDGMQINASNSDNGSANNLSSRLADLDLGEIERVEVVQGAAASTIYGAQGANGVIQIFTKKGQEGKVRVNLSSSIGISSALTGNLEKAKFHHYNTLADGRIDASGSGVALAQDPITGIWSTPSAAIDGNTLTDNPFVEQTYDAVDQLFKTALSTRNSVSVSGGNAKGTYSVFGSRLTQESNLFGDLERLNLRLGTQINITDKLKLTSSTTLITSNNTTGGITGSDNVFGGLSYAVSAPQYIDLQFRNSAGQYVANPTDDNSINPYYSNTYRTYNADVARVIQNLGLNYKLNKFVELDYKYGIDHYRYDYREFTQNQSDIISTSFLDPVDGRIIERTERETLQNHLASVFVRTNFAEDFGSSLKIKTSTQLAFDYRKRVYDRITATGSSLPTFSNDVLISSASQYDITANNTPFVTYGFLVNQKFEYGDLLGVSGGFRTDWSSAFGEASKPFTFPRADMYFRISELDFFKGVKRKVSELKVRAAYGQAGIQPGAFDRFITLSTGQIDQSAIISVPTTSNNPLLDVQVSTEFEAGLDANLLVGSEKVFPFISLNFTYWNRTSDDVIRAIGVAPSTGASAILTNAITFESNGIQASLNADVLDLGNFVWGTTMNFTKSVTDVADISNNADIPLGNNHVIKEGTRLGSFFGFAPLTSIDQTDSEGNPYIAVADQGSYEVGPNGYVVNSTSKQVAFTSDKVLMGDANPDFNISFINSLTYKDNLTFSFQFDWIKGMDVYNQTRQWLYRDLIHGDLDAPVTINGTTGAFTAYYQSLYKTNDPNSHFVEDASFLRLRTMSVSYDFAELLKPFNKLRLTLSGNNLLTFTDYKGMDPEAASGLNLTATRGLDQYAFPNFRTFNVRLDIGF